MYSNIGPSSWPTSKLNFTVKASQYQNQLSKASQQKLNILTGYFTSKTHQSNLQVINK